MDQGLDHRGSPTAARAGSNAGPHAIDAQAMAWLKRFKRAVYYGFNLVCLPEQLRADAWQETCMRMVQRFRRHGEPYGTGLAMAVQVGRNVAIDTLRSQGRRHAELPESLAAEAPDIHEALDRVQAHERLHAAIEMLTPLQRAVMRRVVRGASLADVATEYEMTPGAAKAIAHRARASLRLILAGR